MNKIKEINSGFATAEARWARFGPYYAMFPLDFALEVVQRHSKKGDVILDPFAGRYSSIYAAGVLGRKGVGIEINPIGWLYGSVKLGPAKKEKVLKRLEEIFQRRNLYGRAINKLPEFYKICYCREVLKFLLSARYNLDWKRNKVDATLMAFLILYLHGKIGEALSNQMQITKAMGVNYSMEWWKKNKKTTPPEINPFEFVSQRIEWRYSKGAPRLVGSYAQLGDSTSELKRLISKRKNNSEKFSLLFTSPPYHSITDYHIDQWLRLWLLGGNELPKTSTEEYKGRFLSKNAYHDLLNEVFKASASLMNKKSTIYVRTDSREFTLNTTLEVLKKHFPKHKARTTKRPFRKKNQTELFGNKTNKTGEIDIVMKN